MAGLGVATAASAWKCLQGAFCIYKPPRTSLTEAMKFIPLRLAKDLNSKPMPPIPPRVEVTGIIKCTSIKFNNWMHLIIKCSSVKLNVIKCTPVIMSTTSSCLPYPSAWRSQVNASIIKINYFSFLGSLSDLPSLPPPPPESPNF